jgi:hypothetical protein
MIMDNGDFVFEVDWPLIISTVISTLLPLLVGLVTKTTTSGGLKAVLLAGLAFLNAGLTEVYIALTENVVFDVGTWLVGAIASFAVAVGSHYGFWKPTGVTGAVQSVGPKHPPEPKPNATPPASQPG